MTEGYSLVKVIATIELTWLWISFLQLATKFVNSSSCCSKPFYVVNNQITLQTTATW